MQRPAILASLQSGKMKAQGEHLTQAGQVAVSNYLGMDASPSAHMTGYCPRDLDPPADLPAWHGWGVNSRNVRFQPKAAAKLTRQEVPKLTLKWAFGFPGASATFGQPTVYDGTLFVGSEDGTVYSLDARTGCIWWSFKASATVKTAVSVGTSHKLAFFGDTNGYVYAVSVSNGSVAWKVRPENHPAARITGSPLLLSNRLYVPISSGEEGAAADARYPCCTFRGGVVALDANNGRQLWKAYAITTSAKPTGKNALGVQHYGPSGAAVWSAPAADLKRRTLFVATGNNYSDPPTSTSDAVLAFDIDTGRMLWSRQFTANDLWNIACVADTPENCPKNRGKDFDFGAPPMLVNVGEGKDILFAAQKSGVVYALDPDRRGQILWQRRLGKGGPLGGIQWGGASDGAAVYYPLSDWDDSSANIGGGLFALNALTGRRLWHAAPKPPECKAQFGCSAAQMAPTSLIPGVVFSGSLDGHLRAYDTRNGSVIWDFNTLQTFSTVNGVASRGGSMNGSGPTIVEGMVYVNSGYTNAIDGNVLLAFGADK